MSFSNDPLIFLFVCSHTASCTTFKLISKISTNWLKRVISNLIGPEQNGFLAGKSFVDNILAIQQIANSLENDTHSMPRMMVKVDIKKAYDCLDCSAIIATLRKMNFPEIWVDWIRACLTSSSFSFLINVQPSLWIKACMGT